MAAALRFRTLRLNIAGAPRFRDSAGPNMDDNDNYYFCYDYYYDDVGDDGRDFRADFPGGRCWEPVEEPMVLQDSAGQVAGGGLPAVADHRGTGRLYVILVSYGQRESRGDEYRPSGIAIYTNIQLNVQFILTTVL